MICLYKSLILPVLLYGAETLTMTSSDEQALGVVERKILRKIVVDVADKDGLASVGPNRWMRI